MVFLGNRLPHLFRFWCADIAIYVSFINNNQNRLGNLPINDVEFKYM